MNCTKCDNVFKCNGEIHDNCHINDEGLVCPDCVENSECDCEHCEYEDEKWVYPEEWDTCERCKEVVRVGYVTGEGYTIGDCEFTDRMLCRKCLDLMTKRYEIKRSKRLMKKGKFVIVN